MDTVKLLNGKRISLLAQISKVGKLRFGNFLKTTTFLAVPPVNALTINEVCLLSQSQQLYMVTSKMIIAKQDIRVRK